jgi:hypothetical protein
MLVAGAEKGGGGKGTRPEIRRSKPTINAVDNPTRAILFPTYATSRRRDPSNSR